MTRNDAVWIVGGGLLQCAIIREAQTLGFHTIVTDGDVSAPGAALADEFHHLSTYAVLEHVQLAYTLLDSHSHTIRGCCTAGSDVAPTVAAVCEVLETPGIPLAVAQTTHNKVAVRAALDAAGLQRYQPRWQIGDAGDWGGFDALGGYPVVVKPFSQRASRGVTLVPGPTALAAAFARAAQYGRQVLVEQALTGTEHSAEVVFDASGACVHFHMCDRFFDYSRAVPLETGHINGSSEPPQVQAQVKAVVLACASALKATIGSFKCDLLINDTGIFVLECAARASGGWDSQWTYPQSSGDNLLRRILQVACGLPVDPQPSPLPRQSYAACAAILPQVSGVLLGIPDGAQEPWPHWRAEHEGWIEEHVWAVQPGDGIAPATHNGARAGYVLATADDYATAWQRAKSAADALAQAVRVEAC